MSGTEHFIIVILIDIFHVNLEQIFYFLLICLSYLSTQIATALFLPEIQSALITDPRVSTLQENTVRGLIIAHPTLIIQGHVHGEFHLGKFLGFGTGVPGH